MDEILEFENLNRGKCFFNSSLFFDVTNKQKKTFYHEILNPKSSSIR